MFAIVISWYCEHTEISVKKEVHERIRKNGRYKRDLFSEKIRLKCTVGKLQRLTNDFRISAS